MIFRHISYERFKDLQADVEKRLAALDTPRVYGTIQTTAEARRMPPVRRYVPREFDVDPTLPLPLVPGYRPESAAHLARIKKAIREAAAVFAQ